MSKKQNGCPTSGSKYKKRQHKPRDLGLLLWCLLYRVPIDAEITPQWIEVARKHCKMSPDRLNEVKEDPALQHHWERMDAKRAARRRYFKKHGEAPPKGYPLLPGEPDRTVQVMALQEYWQTVAKLKARNRKKPNAQDKKLLNRYRAIRRLQSSHSKLEALNDIEARFLMDLKARTGNLSMQDYRLLRSMISSGK